MSAETLDTFHPEKPPTCTAIGEDGQISDENRNAPCVLHTESVKKTLHDAYAQESRTKKCVHSPNATLLGSADEDRCAKCAIKDAVLVSTAYMHDIRMMKKESRKLSRSEKKALKVEVVSFLEEIKSEVRQTWRDKPEDHKH